MCIILDANLFGKFDDLRNEDMKPVHRWLNNRNGKIVYSDAEKIQREWKIGRGTQRLTSLRQSGQLKLVSKRDVEERESALRGKIQSDDEHIIALALVARVKVLVSSDQALHRDFKNLVGGRVYQTKSHSHLLTKDTCP